MSPVAFAEQRVSHEAAASDPRKMWSYPPRNIHVAPRNDT